ncbi:MAG: DNA alkylation repair protein, partial [Pseudomonadota bacterium]
RDHQIAGELWDSGIHEARILASMIEIRDLVTKDQAERWVRDFNSWDLCDQCCNNLFSYLPFARSRALEWSRRPEEFVKRAGFVLMACIAVHDKKADDESFERFLAAIEREALDDRNYVKKAVNWALRQIGKRNPALNGMAAATARSIAEIDSKSAKWIASDALRELTGPGVCARLAGKGN